MIPVPPNGWWFNPNKFLYELRDSRGVACSVSAQAVEANPGVIQVIEDYHFGGRARLIITAWDGSK